MRRIGRDVSCCGILEERLLVLRRNFNFLYKSVCNAEAVSQNKLYRYLPDNWMQLNFWFFASEKFPGNLCSEPKLRAVRGWKLVKRIDDPICQRLNPVFNSCGQYRSICPRWPLIPHILRSGRDHVCGFAFQHLGLNDRADLLSSYSYQLGGCESASAQILQRMAKSGQ